MGGARWVGRLGGGLYATLVTLLRRRRLVHRCFSLMCIIIVHMRSHNERCGNDLTRLDYDNVEIR